MSTGAFRNQTGDELRMERDMIEVSSFSPRPDPGWVFVDSHGHEHRWINVNGRLQPGAWHWELDPGEPEFWTDADGDEHNGEGRNHCDLCGDEITPGMRGPSPYREFIAGPVSYWLNDRPISADEADAFIAANTPQRSSNERR
jgi:hypothetical protein